jgi:type IV secretory pathway TrbD component
MQVPDAAKALYPDAAIRAALATLVIRSTVPIEEQLGLVPFKVDELAGFRVTGVLPGRAVMLSDAPADRGGPPEAATEPHIFVAIAPGGPAQNSERDNFARELLATFPNLKEIRVVSSEPLRMGGQQGHQILANAKDAAGAATLTVVQWLRFGGGAYMQMVGIARTDAWKDAYPRFRSVRDGIEPR